MLEEMLVSLFSYNRLMNVFTNEQIRQHLMELIGYIYS